jgi:hypothetical protein
MSWQSHEAAHVGHLKEFPLKRKAAMQLLQKVCPHGRNNGLNAGSA